jgi:hypothetical protein
MNTPAIELQEREIRIVVGVLNRSCTISGWADVRALAVDIVKALKRAKLLKTY